MQTAGYTTDYCNIPHLLSATSKWTVACTSPATRPGFGGAIRDPLAGRVLRPALRCSALLCFCSARGRLFFLRSPVVGADRDRRLRVGVGYHLLPIRYTSHLKNLVSPLPAARWDGVDMPWPGMRRSARCWDSFNPPCRIPLLAHTTPYHTTHNPFPPGTHQPSTGCQIIVTFPPNGRFRPLQPSLTGVARHEAPSIPSPFLTSLVLRVSARWARPPIVRPSHVSLRPSLPTPSPLAHSPLPTTGSGGLL